MKIQCGDLNCRFHSEGFCSREEGIVIRSGECASFAAIHTCGDCAKFGTDRCTANADLRQLMSADDAAACGDYYDESEINCFVPKEENA